MHQKTTVRWAILGAGKIAHKFAQDFSATQRGQLVAVASQDGERAQAFATHYTIPQVLSYDDLYKSTEIEAVYIATTHNFHYEQSLRCIESGKAVLCEKPVTLNDGEFKKLAAAAAAKGVFFMEGLWTYFLPSFLKAKEWLDNGRIGTLKMIQADFGFAMPFDPQGRLFNPALAGGSLLDLGVYLLAVADYFGAATPQHFVASGIVGSTGVDETVSMTVKYNGVVASLATSLTTRLRNSLLLFGESGHIELPYFWKAKTALLYNGEHEVTETAEDNRTTWGYNFEIQHATDAILDGRLQSNVVSHAVSNRLQEQLTEARRQIGVIYPMEK